MAVQQHHVRLIVILAKVKIRNQMESRRMALKIRLVLHQVAQIAQIAQIQVRVVPIPIRVVSVHTQIVQVHRQTVLILIQITHHQARGNQALAQVVPLVVALHLLN
ncbi:hypothetical protein AN161_11300 [Lysinibacillus sp. FJAT-14222]|nr:hypothetical protein AN161_11300 [Lysinibacillus sp. FJAT-14222]